MTALPMLFDTHVHLDRMPPPLNPSREAEAARQAGVGRFLLPGVFPQDWPHLLAVAESIPGAHAAPGVHPMAATSWDRPTAQTLEGLLGRKTVAAIGEIGLDGGADMPSMALQKSALREQIRLAVAAQVPILLHCRKATGRLLEILKQEGAGRSGGLWHGFSGSYETARAAIDLGFGLAFGGALTWTGARRAPHVIPMLPQQSIVLESDAPFRAPHPHRGQTNRPAYLPLVAAKVADLRNWSMQETARITTANALRLLRLPQTWAEA